MSVSEPGLVVKIRATKPYVYRTYVNVKQLAGCHRVQDIEKSLLIWLEQKELAPESLGRCRIIDRVIIGEDIEQMKIQLDYLRLEVVRPELECQWRVHHGATVLLTETLTSFFSKSQGVPSDSNDQQRAYDWFEIRLRDQEDDEG